MPVHATLGIDGKVPADQLPAASSGLPAGTGYVHVTDGVADVPTETAVPSSHALNVHGAAVASVDFGSQQAISFCLENRTDDPSTPAVGQMWLRTDL
jgi:hypothetical protein